MRCISIAVLTSVLISTQTIPALAYVGPGVGLSVLGALWGVLVAIILSLGFVILVPIRRLLKRARQRQDRVGA